MATISVSATATLSANGSSTASGRLTWARPALPDDAVISDISVSGTWTWNGRGNITYVEINGTHTSADYSFDVSLGGSAVSPYTITCRGNNKNAKGSDFSWTDLTITYTYTTSTPSSRIYIKQNGIWTEYSKVYIKTNGAWVEQSDWSSVFNTTTNYVKMN